MFIFIFTYLVVWVEPNRPLCAFGGGGVMALNAPPPPPDPPVDELTNISKTRSTLTRTLTFLSFCNPVVDVLCAMWILQEWKQLTS